MVDASIAGQKGAEVISQILTGGVLIVGGLILAGIILGIALYIRYLRQFNVRVEILSIRGRGVSGEPIYKIVRDVGGFIERKIGDQKQRMFRLRGEKVDLPTPPLEALQLDHKGTNNLKILQKSDSEYYYLLPDEINFNCIVRNGMKIPVARSEMMMVEGDVGYWGQLKKRDNKKIFDMEHWAMKLLPYIIPTLMFMLVIFLTYMITDHWGEFSAAADSLRQAAETLRDVTSAQAAIG